MTRLRASILGLITWSVLRYAMAGVLVTLFNLGMPVLLSITFGIPLEECIPASYVLAAMLQFTLQRLFVFRHISEFALSLRRQALWYVMIVAIQYPIAALATAFLPSVLGLSERIVYVVTALTVAFATFLFLRRNVFQSREEINLGEPIASAGSPADESVGIS